MTRLAAAIAVGSLEQALAAAARAAEQGADMVEFRIDRFTDDPAAVRQLVEKSPLPCLVTCRPVWEGGLYEGDEEKRLALLAAGGGTTSQKSQVESHKSETTKPQSGGGAVYVDMELAAWQKSAAVRKMFGAEVNDEGAGETPSPGGVNAATLSRRERDQGPGAAAGAKPGAGAGLILSSHDFTGRPVDLYQRIEAMTAAAACRVVKVAWTARSLRDNLEAFEILAQRHKPTIALCMGEAGLPSRVLAKKFGALLTFVSLEDGSATAPGQPTLREMKDLYRWDHIGPRTKVYGVIGHPVGHSLSPAIHNAGFDATGFDGVYLPLPIPPEYEHFKATLLAFLEAKGLDFMGASVTIPHKENLLRFAREYRSPRSGGKANSIEPLAEAIGAANTLVVREDGTLAVSNTDYAAALEAVCAAMGIEPEELGRLRVGVIGAGGAARAIVAGFAHRGASVVVYNRTVERAETLAQQFDGSEPLSLRERMSRSIGTGEGAASGSSVGRRGRVTAAGLDALRQSDCQVFINCTPLGMHPRVEGTPIPPGSEPRNWGPGTVVFDTIYNPAHTRLLREARAAGCLTISGTEMFVRQAAGQFKLWTGLEAPVAVFRKKMMESL